MSIKLTCSRSIKAWFQSYKLSKTVNIKRPINISKLITTCTLCVGKNQKLTQLPPLRFLCSATHGLLRGPVWGHTWTLFLFPTHSSIPNPNTLSCDMSQIHVQLAPLRPLCSASHGLLSGSAWGPTWTLFLILTHSSTPTTCTLIEGTSKTPTQLSQFRPPCSASHRLLRKPALGPIWTLLLILAAITWREILSSLLAYSSILGSNRPSHKGRLC